MTELPIGIIGSAPVDLILLVDNQGQHCVRITGEGKFYRYGREIETDAEFVEAMREVVRRVFPAPQKHLVPLTEFTLNEPTANPRGEV